MCIVPFLTFTSSITLNLNFKSNAFNATTKYITTINIFMNFFQLQDGFLFLLSHTFSQNDKDEQKIKSINNIMRILLTHASLPPTFGHHALQMATYLLNIIPSKTKHNFIPRFLFYKKHPTYTHLWTFKCLCYPLIPSTCIHKQENHSTPCVFLW